MPHDPSIWNIYGPAEATINCTHHVIDKSIDITSVPIGSPLSGYRCMILDDIFQSVIIEQQGELFIGGVGVFAGYLRRNDLTSKVSVEIDNETFYRTGDLVRMDNNGLLHYISRKDFQVKLHGQRIELGEIERCLLDTSISTCIVTKWGDDHLIAYVQSCDINEEQLRLHCQSHLPPHMIPSIFIILDKLPLNANGKIDRKQLPPPRFCHFASTQLTDKVELIQPINDIEVIIHHIWCDIFQQNQISTDTNIFTLSVVIHFFSCNFCIDIKMSFISKQTLFLFLNYFNIQQLFIMLNSFIKLLNITQNIHHYHWSSLHLTQGKK